MGVKDVLEKLDIKKWTVLLLAGIILIFGLVIVSKHLGVNVKIGFIEIGSQKTSSESTVNSNDDRRRGSPVRWTNHRPSKNSESGRSRNRN